jgi:hypothetical protein
MASNQRLGHDEARKRLLEEGARSYLEAITALVEYQREVQKQCRKVMEENLDEYANVLGVKLTSDEIQNCSWPSFQSWEGDWSFLGVHIFRDDITPFRWWDTSCCLQFDSEKGHYCFVGQEFQSTKVATQLFRAIQPLEAKVKQSGSEVWIQHNLTVEETTSLAKPLGEIFQRWTELWAKVGGINGVFVNTVSNDAKPAES